MGTDQEPQKLNQSFQTEIKKHISFGSDHHPAPLYSVPVILALRSLSTLAYLRGLAPAIRLNTLGT